MGQATAALPDPLETPSPASLSGTDDLLAQLAGDEIDRLLAESGVELPDDPPSARAAATAAVTAPVAAPIAQTPAAPAAIDAPRVPPKSAVAPVASAPVPASPVPASPAASPAVAAVAASAPPPPPVVVAPPVVTSSPPNRPAVVVEPATAETEDDRASDAPVLSPELLESDAELDALLEEMSRAEQGVSGGGGIAAGTEAAGDARPAAAPDARPPQIGPAGNGAPAASVAIAPRVVEAEASEPLMSAAEREALSLTDIAAATDAAEQRDAEVVAGEPGHRRPSLGVRLLELLNVPLAFVPDGMRDALGKIAILTLVNSLAVLIYVLFLRG